MLGRSGRVLHVCAAEEPATKETIVITVYEPDPVKWETDFKTRRKP